MNPVNTKLNLDPSSPSICLGCPDFHWLNVLKTFNPLGSNYFTIISTQNKNKSIFNMCSCVYYQIKFTFSRSYKGPLLTHYELNSSLRISLQTLFFNHSFIQSIIYQISNTEGHWTSIWSFGGKKKRHCSLGPQTWIQRLNR